MLPGKGNGTESFMRIRVRRLLSLILVVTMLLGVIPNNAVTAWGSVIQTGQTNDFPIVVGSTSATIWVDSKEETPVQRVIKDFQADVNRVTGRTPTVSNSASMPSGPVVLIGTLGKSTLINNLIASGKSHQVK